MVLRYVLGGLGLCVASHSAVTAVAVGRSLSGPAPAATPRPAGPDTASAGHDQNGRSLPPASAGLPGHAPAVAATVVAMYDKCQVDRSSFSDAVVFEDPAVCCDGISEVAEAFRALQALQPETLAWAAELSSVQGRALPSVTSTAAGLNGLQVDIWQKYLLGGSPFELYSRVDVTYDGEGRIVHLQDRWQGKELLRSAPFEMARRVNGWLSYRVTPVAIRPAGEGK